VAAGAAAGQMTRSMEGHAGAVAAVCWPSADTIYSGSWDRSVRQWDAETGALTQVRRALSASCPFFGSHRNAHTRVPWIVLMTSGGRPRPTKAPGEPGR